MRNDGKSPLAAALLGLVLLTGLSACDTMPVTAYYGGYGSNYSYGIAYDDYYYYPSTRVYYRPYSGFYFYPSGNSWIRVRTLPTAYLIDDRYRVVIRDSHGKPWARNHEHRKYHRARHQHRVNPEADRRERKRNRELHRKLHMR